MFTSHLKGKLLVSHRTKQCVLQDVKQIGQQKRGSELVEGFRFKRTDLVEQRRKDL